MGKAKKRPRDDGPAAGPAAGGDEAVPAALRAALANVPLGTILALRRDLAMGPFVEALRLLRDAGPYEAAVDALDEAQRPEDGSYIRSLRDLCRNYRGFTQTLDFTSHLPASWRRGTRPLRGPCRRRWACRGCGDYYYYYYYYLYYYYY